MERVLGVRMEARPAVAKGVIVGKELRENVPNLADDKEAQKILFGQTAAVVKQ